MRERESESESKIESESKSKSESENERERAHIGEGVEVAVDEERRVPPQILLQPTPYPDQLTPYPSQSTPYPGQLTFYPDNCRPTLATYVFKTVEAVVHEEWRVRPQVLLL